MKKSIKNQINFSLTKLVILVLFLTFSLQGQGQINPRTKKKTESKIPLKREPKTAPIKRDPKTGAPIYELQPMTVITSVTPMDVFATITEGSPTSTGGRKSLMAINSGSLSDTHNSDVRKLSDRNTSTAYCTRERLNLESKIKRFEEMPVGSRPDWLKPGIILKARSFVNGSYQIEENYDRYPITISTPDLRNVSKTYITIPDPRQKSKISEAENQLISQNASPVAANMSFRMTEIKSREDLSFKLTGRYSGGLGSFAASLGIEAGTQKNYHYYLVEFSQYMFSLEVDGLDAEAVFKTSDPVPYKDYVYISKVDYGRKGGVLFKSKRSIQEYGATVTASSGFSGISKTELNALYSQLYDNSEVEIKAFMYGGTSSSAANTIVDVQDEGIPNIGNWITSQPGNHRYALPIGFELKNLWNQQVGMDNSMIQEIETCVEKRNYQLKMTLTDIQNVDGRDGGGDDPDDYGLQMAVVLKAQGKVFQPSSTQINKFPGAPCGFGDPSRNQISGPYTCWMGGGVNKQLHVRENRTSRDPFQINNTLIFDIPWDAYTDPKQEMKIYTWLKEYTGSNDKVIHDSSIGVELREVLDVLSGIKALNPTKTFPDGQIAQGAYRFSDFGATHTLWLTNVPDTGGKYILEGPIKAGNAGEKAAIWVRFELLN
ncbi:thiol-activated cytolysin family protein [Algoriphagus sp.]|uniref:thiol-activated cytolysin family protein n=1 Tax=Algoriphagus sp. TaxID=1872435 RepID=UPI00261FC5FD|nr:thiol-activated cytolysin family protein [Algoriphagus sp.]